MVEVAKHSFFALKQQRKMDLFNKYYGMVIEHRKTQYLNQQIVLYTKDDSFFLKKGTECMITPYEFYFHNEKTSINLNIKNIHSIETRKGILHDYVKIWDSKEGLNMAVETKQSNLLKDRLERADKLIDDWHKTPESASTEFVLKIWDIINGDEEKIQNQSEKAKNRLKKYGY